MGPRHSLPSTTDDSGTDIPRLTVLLMGRSYRKVAFVGQLQPKPLLRIKAERLARGWTQLELAYRSRVPVSELSRIETGRSNPYPAHAMRLAETLGISEHDLLEDIE